MSGNKSKYGFLSKNILLFSISAFGQKILAFFLVPLYTNVLTTAQYGTVDLITTTVSLLVPIFTVNIAEGVMRFTLGDKNSTGYLSYGIKVTLKGSLILLACLLIFALTPFSAGIITELPWLFGIYLVTCIYNIQQSYLRATDRVAVMAVGSLLNSVIMMALNIVLLTWFKLGISGYFISMFAGLSAAVLYMEIRGNLRSKIRIKPSCPKNVRSESLKYCIPTIFTVLAWWINSSLDRYFVTAICGVNQNGIYSIAYKIPTILGVFQNIFVQAWTLSAITEFDKNDKDGFFGKTYELYNSMMVLITSSIIFANVLMSKILYAKDFFVAWHCVPLLLMSSLFSALSGYLGSIFSAAKDTKTCAVSTIISAAVNVVLNAVLIPLFGIMGAAYATAVAYITAWLIRLIVSRKYIAMKISFARNTVTYILLSAQAVCAMTESHLYIVQAILVALILLLNYKVYVTAFSQLMNQYVKRGK